MFTQYIMWLEGFFFSFCISFNTRGQTSTLRLKGTLIKSLCDMTYNLLKNNIYNNIRSALTANVYTINVITITKHILKHEKLLN